MPESLDDLAADGDSSVEYDHAALVTWVMTKVDRWREFRDNAFKERWGEYYRLWRGRWSERDRTRNSERSRLIAPALSQAIDMTVAEMEEATFGRQQWFDVRQDLAQQLDPEAKAAIYQARDNLLEDAERDGVTDAIAMTYLNGALFGNGIGKIVVDTKMVRSPGDPDPITGEQQIKEVEKVCVRLDPLPADEVVPDPTGVTVDEMLGIAHELNKPTSWVQKQQTRGVYLTTAAVLEGQEGRDSDAVAEREDGEGFLKTSDTTFITEYHGLVPANLLPLPEAETKEEAEKALDDLLEEAEVQHGEEVLVEAIVTIADKQQLLKAVKNPFWMKDRSIISYQHDKVPGRFWGRSVAEKGFNPQKALDAELRSRMDAMALITNPMLMADITRMPRGQDMRIRPGKLWLTNGPPREVLSPIQFQGLDPNTFNQTGEMERMVQMGTGAMDTATPIKMNERNSTATGTSVQMQSFVKRSKRAMNNVNRNFLQPLIQKMLWRYMQFDPARYPQDVEFRVSGTLGIVARELEQNQLTQMLGLVEQGSEPYGVLIKAIFDNTSSPYKAEINHAVDQMLAPPSPEEQAQAEFLKQMELAEAQSQHQKTELENNKLQSEALLNIAKVQDLAVKGDIEGVNLQLELQRLVNEFEKTKQTARQNDAALLNAAANLAKARQTGGNSNGNKQE